MIAYKKRLNAKKISFNVDCVVSCVNIMFSGSIWLKPHCLEFVLIILYANQLSRITKKWFWVELLVNSNPGQEFCGYSMERRVIPKRLISQSIGEWERVYVLRGYVHTHHSKHYSAPVSCWEFWAQTDCEAKHTNRAASESGREKAPLFVRRCLIMHCWWFTLAKSRATISIVCFNGGVRACNAFCLFLRSH
jgi:hypothetical protein